MTELGLLAVVFLQGRPVPPSTASQNGFFDWMIWLLVAVPFAIMIAIGMWNKKPKQTVTEFDAESFRLDVLGGETPTLVHFYRSWSIGDQVMIAQIERLATKAHGYEVGFVDVERWPDLLGAHSEIRAPALVLFAGGKRIFQSGGVHDEADIDREVRDAVLAWERESLREGPATS